MFHARRLLAVGALGFALPAAAPATASASHAERALAERVNDFRAAHGLRRLRLSGSLSHSAERYATHILRTNHLHHHRRVWASGSFSNLGENLGWQSGRRYSSARIFRLWRGSSSHRRVMLSSGVRYLGVGRDYGRLGRWRATVWVLQLGRR